MITLHDFSEQGIRDAVNDLMQPQVRQSELIVDGNGNPIIESRHAHVRERFKVMHDDFDDLADAWIRDVWREPKIIAELCRHVLPLFNPPKRAVDRLAVAYTHHPIRRIKGKKTATKMWSATLAKSRFDLHMREFNRGQIAYNTHVVIPLLRRTADGDKVFDFQTITGAIGQQYSDHDLSDFEPPDVLFWRLPSFVGDPIGKPVVRAVDSEFFVAFDRNGHLIRSETRRHGLGMFPGALFRNTIPADTGPDEDAWWDPWPSKGAYRAMRSVTRVIANLDWTRKTQCRYLIAEIVDDESKGPGVVDEQVMGDAEGVLRLRGESVQLMVNNMVVSVKDWKDHVRMFQDEALEQYTGAIATLSDPDPEHPLLGQTASEAHSAVDLHRAHQVNFLRPADLRLQRVMAAILTRTGSSDAVEPELLKDNGEVEFTPLPFIEDREKRLNWYILASKFGIADQVMAAVEFHGWTEDEAIEKLKAMQGRRAALREIQMTHNMPADATKDEEATEEEDPALVGEGMPERQGRMGGRTSPPSQAEAAR